MSEFTKRATLFIAGIFLLSACADPVQKDIVTFGETADVLATATGGIYQRHRDIVDRDNLERSVLKYSDRTIADFPFPPAQPQKPIDPKLWQLRLKAMNAIRSYAKALANLNDPTAPAAAESGLSSLGTAVAGLSKSTTLEPATQIAAGIVGAAIRKQNTAAIRMAIADVHPQIKAVTAALTDDFESVQGLIVRDRAAWIVDASQNLRVLRRDPNVNAMELASAYRDAAERYSVNEALVGAYQQSVEALEKFEEAHRALRDSRDSDRALSEFLTTTRGLTENLASLRNGGA